MRSHGTHSCLIVSQKWRQRWFVLKQSGQIPGQHLLEYYMGKNSQERQEFIINNLRVELDAVEEGAVPAAATA